MEPVAVIESQVGTQSERELRENHSRFAKVERLAFVDFKENSCVIDPCRIARSHVLKLRALVGKGRRCAEWGEKCKDVCSYMIRVAASSKGRAVMIMCLDPVEAECAMFTNLEPAFSAPAHSFLGRS